MASGGDRIYRIHMGKIQCKKQDGKTRRNVGAHDPAVEESDNGANRQIPDEVVRVHEYGALRPELIVQP